MNGSTDTGARSRWRLRVAGTVQGVGFRPFVYTLAQRFGLGGWVLNDAGGVVIEIEGDAAALESFSLALRSESPPLARITAVSSECLPPSGESTFSILASRHDTQKHAFVSPDAAVCDDCLRELFDPADRRYRYPFINCTNCGPRFTIVRDVPYDRPQTTMAAFALCADCRREYEDPHNRRFHAQPNACPRCGPAVTLQSSQGVEAGQAAIESAARLLDSGNIVAIKGLGGYHLACDATSETAVAELRQRKRRYDKPFALMASDLETVRTLCEVNAAEERLLASHRRPIVLLRQRERTPVASQVAPRQKYLGVMLPYAPLHYVLMDALARLRARGQAQRDLPGIVLVMTSGNLSDEPIAYLDDDARERLKSLADAFLSHNRAIHIRCDDSVTRIVEGKELLLRRSRGYAPEPVLSPHAFRVPLLATGAHLKNTFCLAKDRSAFVSHHIGDLENVETLQSFTQGIEHFKRLFDVAPRAIAHDLHPAYLSTQYAQAQAAAHPELKLIGVQHHHAHIAGVMGEYGLQGPVIGVAFDGTGYGADGTVWGGEFLVADYLGFRRVAHLDTIPLLGGEQAVHQVWRLAAAWLDKVYADAWLDLDIDFVRQVDRAQWRVLKQMHVKQINSPLSSAMGRLFDAVAALIGVRTTANYEAQAAIELEMLADEACLESYASETIDSRPRVLAMNRTIAAIVADLQRGVLASTIAAKFHNTVAESIARTCASIRVQEGLRHVVLGGGVFQNALLLSRTLAALRALDFDVFVPEQLPLNDGGLAFGQALIANAQLDHVYSLAEV